MSVMAYAPYGAGGIIIRVEADIRRGIPGIDITGLAEGAVREARERVRAAFRNSGFTFPLDRILINLAPAGLRKDGAALDMPIALAVMGAAEIVQVPSGLLVMGELELSGRIRPVRGVLAAIACGMEEGISEFIVPAENGREAAILGGGLGEKSDMRFASVSTLREAVDVLLYREKNGTLPENGGVLPITSTEHQFPAAIVKGDFSDVRGQIIYKRALEIAAAGGHNTLVFGPPGAGKTMLARMLPSIMAPLTADEAVEVTRLHSLAGPLRADGNAPGGFIDRLIQEPPFRSPHHSASAEGILGGGKTPHPGEITLAHYGILFLDEAPEFKTNVLQALREPLEDKVISISRAEGQLRLPAEFQLLLAANACPCGRLGIRHSVTEASAYNAAQICLCSPEEISRYWRKIGGALLDRIELRAAVIPPETDEIGGTSEENLVDRSEKIAARVRAAVAIQRRRFADTKIRRNAGIPAGKMEEFCPLNDDARSALNRTLARLGLSGRAYHGILRVARTIADLENTETIVTVHIEEAVYHRRYGEDPYEIVTIGR